MDWKIVRANSTKKEGFSRDSVDVSNKSRYTFMFDISKNGLRGMLRENGNHNEGQEWVVHHPTARGDEKTKHHPHVFQLFPAGC